MVPANVYRTASTGPSSDPLCLKNESALGERSSTAASTATSTAPGSSVDFAAPPAAPAAPAARASDDATPFLCNAFSPATASRTFERAYRAGWSAPAQLTVANRLECRSQRAAPAWRAAVSELAAWRSGTGPAPSVTSASLDVSGEELRQTILRAVAAATGGCPAAPAGGAAGLAVSLTAAEEHPEAASAPVGCWVPRVSVAAEAGGGGGRAETLCPDRADGRRHKRRKRSHTPAAAASFIGVVGGVLYDAVELLGGWVEVWDDGAGGGKAAAGGGAAEGGSVVDSGNAVDGGRAAAGPGTAGLGGSAAAGPGFASCQRLSSRLYSYWVELGVDGGGGEPRLVCAAAADGGAGSAEKRVREQVRSSPTAGGRAAGDGPKAGEAVRTIFDFSTCTSAAGVIPHYRPIAAGGAEGADGADGADGAEGAENGAAKSGAENGAAKSDGGGGCAAFASAAARAPAPNVALHAVAIAGRLPVLVAVGGGGAGEDLFVDRGRAWEAARAAQCAGHLWDEYRRLRAAAKMAAVPAAGAGLPRATVATPAGFLAFDEEWGAKRILPNAAPEAVPLKAAPETAPLETAPAAPPAPPAAAPPAPPAAAPPAPAPAPASPCAVCAAPIARPSELASCAGCPRKFHRRCATPRLRRGDASHAQPPFCPACYDLAARVFGLAAAPPPATPAAALPASPEAPPPAPLPPPPADDASLLRADEFPFSQLARCTRCAADDRDAVACRLRARHAAPAAADAAAASAPAPLDVLLRSLDVAVAGLFAAERRCRSLARSLEQARQPLADEVSRALAFYRRHRPAGPIVFTRANQDRRLLYQDPRALVPDRVAGASARAPCPPPPGGDPAVRANRLLSSSNVRANNSSEELGSAARGSEGEEERRGAPRARPAASAKFERGGSGGESADEGPKFGPGRGLGGQSSGGRRFRLSAAASSGRRRSVGSGEVRPSSVARGLLQEEFEPSRGPSLEGPLCPQKANAEAKQLRPWPRGVSWNPKRLTWSVRFWDQDGVRLLATSLPARKHGCVREAFKKAVALRERSSVFFLRRVARDCALDLHAAADEVAKAGDAADRGSGGASGGGSSQESAVGADGGARLAAALSRHLRWDEQSGSWSASAGPGAVRSFVVEDGRSGSEEVVRQKWRQAVRWLQGQGVAAAAELSAEMVDLVASGALRACGPRRRRASVRPASDDEDDDDDEDAEADEDDEDDEEVGVTEAGVSDDGEPAEGGRGAVRPSVSNSSNVARGPVAGDRRNSCLARRPRGRRRSSLSMADDDNDDDEDDDDGEDDDGDRDGDQFDDDDDDDGSVAVGGGAGGGSGSGDSGGSDGGGGGPDDDGASVHGSLLGDGAEGRASGAAAAAAASAASVAAASAAVAALQPLPPGLIWARTTGRFFAVFRDPSPAYGGGRKKRFKTFDPKKFGGVVAAYNAAVDFLAGVEPWVTNAKAGTGNPGGAASFQTPAAFMHEARARHATSPTYNDHATYLMNGGCSPLGRGRYLSGRPPFGGSLLPLSSPGPFAAAAAAFGTSTPSDSAKSSGAAQSAPAAPGGDNGSDTTAATAAAEGSEGRTAAAATAGGGGRGGGLSFSLRSPPRRRQPPPAIAQRVAAQYFPYTFPKGFYPSHPQVEYHRGRRSFLAVDEARGECRWFSAQSKGVRTAFTMAVHWVEGRAARGAVRAGGADFTPGAVFTPAVARATGAAAACATAGAARGDKTARRASPEKKRLAPGAEEQNAREIAQGVAAAAATAGAAAMDDDGDDEPPSAPAPRRARRTLSASSSSSSAAGASARRGPRSARPRAAPAAGAKAEAAPAGAAAAGGAGAGAAAGGGAAGGAGGGLVGSALTNGGSAAAGGDFTRAASGSLATAGGGSASRGGGSAGRGGNSAGLAAGGSGSGFAATGFAGTASGSASRRSTSANSLSARLVQLGSATRASSEFDSDDSAKNANEQARRLPKVTTICWVPQKQSWSVFYVRNPAASMQAKTTKAFTPVNHGGVKRAYRAALLFAGDAAAAYRAQLTKGRGGRS